MDSSPRSPPPNSTNSAPQLFQVFLRLRPSSPQSSVSETKFLTTAPGQSVVYVTPPLERNRFKAIEKFAFTRIFDETSGQREVFEETVLPLLEDAVIRGRDGTLATLGVTGSGKTHTILGSKNVKGVTQMALDVLFQTFGDRVVDFAKVDLQTLDNSEAIVMDTPTFHERINNPHDSHSSKRSSFAHITTPKSPDVSDIKITLPESKSRYGILLSMYELYNDRIFDLLDESTSHLPSGTTPRRKALIFKKPSTISSWDTTTSKEQKKIVSGLRKVYASTFQEALQILEHGQATRTVSSTNSNSVSSRSHAFLQIEIKRFSPRHTERGSASLHIVDLAGSERARTAKTAGERLAEAGSINRSLMCLGQCLQLQTQATDNGKPSIVPWRQSKLTELLFSNSFSGAGGGGQKASMIVTADAMGDFNATSQILRYSALAREITVPRASSRSLSGMSDSSSSAGSSHSGNVDVLVGGINSLNISTDIALTNGGKVPGEESKDALIARLIAQLQSAESRARDMEERWRDAEDRCLLIEQTVREEVADEMEERMKEVRKQAMERLESEVEWREGYVDGKLEIMKRGIQVHEDAPPSTLERIEDLEDENERLRREVMQLRRDSNNRSPSKQLKREWAQSKPLKDVLNLDAFRQMSLDGER